MAIVIGDHRRYLDAFALRRLEAKAEGRVAGMHFAKELGLDGVLVDGAAKSAPQFDAFSGGDRGDEFPILRTNLKVNTHQSILWKILTINCSG